MKFFDGISIARLQPGVGKESGARLLFPNLFRTVKYPGDEFCFIVSITLKTNLDDLSGITNWYCRKPFFPYKRFHLFILSSG